MHLGRPFAAQVLVNCCDNFLFRSDWSVQGGNLQ